MLVEAYSKEESVNNKSSFYHNKNERKTTGQVVNDLIQEYSPLSLRQRCLDLKRDLRVSITVHKLNHEDSN